MNFSQQLSKLMKQRGLTNYQLAKDLDIHPTTVSNWLSGKEPRKRTLIMLAQYFDISVDELLGEHEKKLISTCRDELDGVYLSFAKDAQENHIDPEDIKLAIETIKKLRNKN